MLGSIVLAIFVIVILYFGLGRSVMGMTMYSDGLNTITNNLFNIFVMFLFCLIPVILFMMAFIFAPLLVGWHGMSAPGAYRLSLLSCLNNWKALLVNGGLWFLISLGVGIIMSIVAGILLFIPILGPVVLFVIFIALVFVVFPIGCANTYFSYKAIFSQEEEFPVEPISSLHKGNYPQ